MDGKCFSYINKNAMDVLKAVHGKDTYDHSVPFFVCFIPKKSHREPTSSSSCQREVHFALKEVLDLDKMPDVMNASSKRSREVARRILSTPIEKFIERGQVLAEQVDKQIANDASKGFHIKINGEHAMAVILPGFNSVSEVCYEP